jgi:hypothetical protein
MHEPGGGSLVASGCRAADDALREFGALLEVVELLFTTDVLRRVAHEDDIDVVKQGLDQVDVGGIHARRLSQTMRLASLAMAPACPG